MRFKNLLNFATIGILLSTNSLIFPVAAELISNSCADTNANGTVQCGQGQEIVQVNTKNEIVLKAVSKTENVNSDSVLNPEFSDLNSDPNLEKELKE